MTDQMQFDEFTGPFVRNDHPSTSHSAAAAVVERDGGMGQLRRGKHRHIVLGVIAAAGVAGVSQQDAGAIAFRDFGVGAGTEAAVDVGRRRCVDLEDMGLICPARRCECCGAAVDVEAHGGFPDKKTTPWTLTALGWEVLRELERERVVRVPWLRR